MAIIHNFQQSLAVSNDWTNWSGWQEIYSTAFPTMIGMHWVKTDGWAQRGGIDRVIVLASGRQLWVDEKVRPKYDFPDICLEYWSDTKRKVPGWIAKDLACDYIAYLIVKSGQCYLLPFHLLRVAWKLHRHEWCKKYKQVKAHNEQGFLTTSIAVPVETLLAAMAEAMQVRFTQYPVTTKLTI